jgi:iron complex outermembrane recepter protein
MIAALLCAAVAASAGNTAAKKSTGDLTQFSMEELMNVEVTSVAKKEQKLSVVPAAVFVITQDDIRRSGATSIPEVLRIVPGLQVARINSNEWAISARGFNDRFANKMLVLIDGRSVYTPLFSGVYWDMQDTLLEDIERIEVIRGPGATMWGANAVNGVINILTKHARDTQGALVTTGAGNQEQGFGDARFGGQAGRLFYRGYARYFNRQHDEENGRAGPYDRWHALRGGFRTDWNLSSADSLTLQGDLYTQRFSGGYTPPDSPQTVVDDVLTPSGGNLLGRWKHAFSDRSGTELQVYYDRYQRSDRYVFGDHRQTIDLEFQHRLAVSSRHELMWGIEARAAADRVDDKPYIRFVPAKRADQLFGGSVQDDFSLVPDRLHLIVGSKLEHSSFGHLALQPSAQVAWTPDSRRTVWASVARAARSPSRVEQNMQVTEAMPFAIGGLPVSLQVMGNPAVRSEDLVAYQVGGRFQPKSRYSLDLATFYNTYGHLVTIDAGAPVFARTPAPHVVLPEVFGNNLRGETYGAEVTGNYNVSHRWRLAAGYSLLIIHLTPAHGSASRSAEAQEGESPRHQGNLRSYLDLTPKLSLDVTLFLVGRLPAMSVPGYGQVDARLSWRPSHQVEFSIAAQNLSGVHHLEFAPPVDQTGNQPDDFGRTAYAKITWRF